MQKMLSKSFVESWSTAFYATGINLFFIRKFVLIVMAPILINKMGVSSVTMILNSQSETTVTFVCVYIYIYDTLQLKN